MRTFFLLLAISSLLGTTQAQNVGIGTTTPAFPLSFPNTSGNKIGLWGTNNNHYGIGIQSGLLQVYSDQTSSHIAFGSGSSTNFTERMRIINAGTDGMQLSGRLLLRNGTSPLNLASGAGVWLYRPDNSSLGGFIGVQNNANIGFYGVSTGWGLVYNIDNGRVGVGTSTPANRLDVAGLNNWDLTNTEGDVRIGNDNHRLKFGVALNGGGVGASSIMQSGGVGLLTLGANSKNLIQLNGGDNSLNLINLTGGLRVDGNAGVSGQVLRSNGSGTSPSWSSQPYSQFFKVPDNQPHTELEGATNSVTIPTLHNQLFSLQTPSRVQLTLCATILPVGFTGTCSAGFQISIFNAANNAYIGRINADGFAGNSDPTTLHATDMLDLPAGVYRLEAVHLRNSGGNSGPSWQFKQRVLIQVFPN